MSDLGNTVNEFMKSQQGKVDQSNAAQSPQDKQDAADKKYNDMMKAKSDALKTGYTPSAMPTSNSQTHFDDAHDPKMKAPSLKPGQDEQEIQGGFNQKM
jgi:hypothetical protein